MACRAEGAEAALDRENELDLESARNEMQFATIELKDANSSLEQVATEYILKLELLMRDDDSLVQEYRDRISKVGNGVLAGEEYNARDYKSILRQVICSALGMFGTLTSVLEYDHIDASYRDVYYAYYSKQHFDFPRRSIRLSLFRGGLSESEFRKSDESRLQEIYLGSFVLNYLSSGIVGRTLLRPSAIGERGLRVRLSCFETTIHGKRLTVEAFPYRMQDGQTMRCAEVTLLNLMCYYSNEYNDYSVVLPSEILKIEERDSVERVVPSKGLSYSALSRVLYQTGFYPRLYSASQLVDSGASGFSRGRTFRRLLHWYIDSGIPVAVNVDTGRLGAEGHSLLCVGYASSAGLEASEAGIAEQDASKKALQVKENDQLRIVEPCTDNCLFAVFSADLHSEYVVIDDNQVPYAVRPYDRLSLHEGMINQNYVVALHRSMILDALDAHESFLQIISLEGWGLRSLCGDYLKEADSGTESNPLVLRMFMASARGYKRSRVRDSVPAIALLYDSVPLPHFVWVLEVFLNEDCYRRKRAFAEIVLDATSGGLDNPTSSVAIMRYPGVFTYRTFDDSQPVSWSYRDSYDSSNRNEWELIPSYEGNLRSLNEDE